MKRSSFLYFLILASAILVSAPGCKKKGKGVTPIPGSASRAPGDGSTGPIDPGGRLGTNPNIITDTDPTGGRPLASRGGIEGRPQDRDIFKANTVYFDLDRASIRASDKPNMEAIANHMKSNPNADLLIEGHCDERGTEGYNLSLGDRRALAAREYLVNSGVSAERLHTVSFGEARPQVPGNGETAWSRNRRAEFVLVQPAQ